MPSDEVRYTNKVFMAGAMPLLKTIATDVPELKKKFEGVDAIYQVSAKVNAEDKEAVHFIIENGEWTVKLGEYLGQKNIDAELAFPSMEKMNEFMKGKVANLLPALSHLRMMRSFRFFFASFISTCFHRVFHSLISSDIPTFTNGHLNHLTVAINGRLSVILNVQRIFVSRQASQEPAEASIREQSRSSI